MFMKSTTDRMVTSKASPAAATPPWCQCYKTFFFRHLILSGTNALAYRFLGKTLSYKGTKHYALMAFRDKHSSLWIFRLKHSSLWILR
jgi:hypothetical protein